MTDEPKNSLPPKAELDAVEDIGAIDVPDAPDGVDERVEATTGTPQQSTEETTTDASSEAVHVDSDTADLDSVDGTPRAEVPPVDAASVPQDETPTVAQSGVQRPPRDIYDVAGRARPQWIVPKMPTADPQPALDEIQMTSLIPSDPLVPGDATEAVDAVNSDAPADSDISVSNKVPDTDAATHVFESPQQSEENFSSVPASYGYSQPAETEFFGAPLADSSSKVATAGAGLMDDPAPQTATLTSIPVAEDAGSAGNTENAEGESSTVVFAPRGTLDLGLLLLRILVGVPLILRGLQTLFGFGGDPGIDALELRFGDFTAGDILAIALPTAEVVGGGLLLLGLATPIGGAVAFIAAGFMALFELSLSEVGYWPYQMSQSAQSWAFHGLIALILIVTGPGRYSADLSRSWATRPRVSAWLWTAISIAGVVALWLFVGGGTPF